MIFNTYVIVYILADLLSALGVRVGCEGTF